MASHSNSEFSIFEFRAWTTPFFDVLAAANMLTRRKFLLGVNKPSAGPAVYHTVKNRPPVIPQMLARAARQ